MGAYFYQPDSNGEAYEFTVHAEESEDHKCGRCWRHLPEVTGDGALCSRCDQVVGAMEPVE